MVKAVEARGDLLLVGVGLVRCDLVGACGTKIGLKGKTTQVPERDT